VLGIAFCSAVLSLGYTWKPDTLLPSLFWTTCCHSSREHSSFSNAPHFSVLSFWSIPVSFSLKNFFVLGLNSSLALARQVLYHWTHAPSPFVLRLFFKWSCSYPLASLGHSPPIPGWDDSCVPLHPALLVGMGSHRLLKNFLQYFLQGRSAGNIFFSIFVRGSLYFSFCFG
jgi:uncharacterized membrane protein YedE/YeeE